MSDHITPLTGRSSLTQNKFTWRFLALSRIDRKANPCRMSVEAYTEQEARQVLALISSCHSLGACRFRR